MPIKRFREAPVWLEDPNAESGWTWTPDEKRAEPTYILPAYAGSVPEEPMTQSQPQQGGELVSFDPDNPHDPAMAQLPPTPAPLVDPVQPDIAVCPCCGTAVSRDRLRG